MTTTRRIDALDVPLTTVKADALRLAYAHQPEPFEAEFAQLACEHPEACSCPDDYPTWTPGGAS